MQVNASFQGVSANKTPTAHTARNVSDMGISALNARETDVGTPSGILMTQFFLITKPKIYTDKKPTIIATNTPFAPVHARGMLSTKNG